MPVPLTAESYARDTLDVARDRIGGVMLHAGAGGDLVETEAHDDVLASHFVTLRHFESGTVPRHVLPRSRATEFPWRLRLRHSPFVSR